MPSARDPISEALTQAFAAEGVDLMGVGTTHWVAAMQTLDRMSAFAARHEHCLRDGDGRPPRAEHAARLARGHGTT